jgi:NAD(P)-dependent dehydrogenase (short-subunit alcohol dehydrogenase family)
MSVPGPSRHFAAIVHGRDVARTHAVVGGIVSAGGDAMAVNGDLATDAGATAVYSETKKAFGGIDILVNNAGAYEARDWFETTPATWRLFFETDVLSAVRLVLAVAPDWPSTALPLAEIAPFISETRMPQLKQ